MFQTSFYFIPRERGFGETFSPPPWWLSKPMEVILTRALSPIRRLFAPFPFLHSLHMKLQESCLVSNNAFAGKEFLQGFKGWVASQRGQFKFGSSRSTNQKKQEQIFRFLKKKKKKKSLKSEQLWPKKRWKSYLSYILRKTIFSSITKSFFEATTILKWFQDQGKRPPR